MTAPAPEKAAPIPADVLADRLHGMMRMAASSEDGFNRLTPAACRLLTQIHEALADRASQEERIREKQISDERLLAEVDEVMSFFRRHGDCWKDGLPPLMRRIRERLAVSQAARDVLAERQRQVSVERWTEEHDDCHETGELAEAAACYAFYARYQPVERPGLWPWDERSWKPKSQRRDLVKAGALILAEIERLDRKEASR